MGEAEIHTFIARWQKAAASERANYQLFLAELCDAIGVPRPEPSTGAAARDLYVFDKPVVRTNPDGTTTTGFIDLYKAGCFVLEAKQGANDDATADRAGHGRRGTRGWDTALERAYNQAAAYIKSLPTADGRPPFLIVCDVGYVIELYSEFTRTGGTYVRFPDPQHHRIRLDDLARPEVRELLKTVWAAPLDLDPARHAAAVTRDVAAKLAELARALERDGHAPAVISPFIQRCLFTMFAEDVELLRRGGFEQILRECLDHPDGFPAMVGQLWREMADGTAFSTILKCAIPYFNGGLFDDTAALPLAKPQIELLHEAARADWSAVEPAIFGTLLERALDPRERHKLGAHYTPRSYVERLVQPTVIQPLREEWDAVRAAAAQLCAQNKEPAARAAVEQYHRRLCAIRVLDPACGSGNFLYVTLEHLKRLEGEVLDLLERLGGHAFLELQGYRIRPEQFHGLEINPRAVAIAQLVLWIGYFQWHFRATGRANTGDRPLLPKQKTIVEQDAVLAYSAKTPRLDAGGNPVTIWDGVTTKPHPVTGREVPDETARIPVFDYAAPARPEWPAADFIVGNPPFIGASRMRDALSDGYTEALRAAWANAVPDSADFVMYWWRKAGELLAAGKTRRFGFITTNSIHQTFNRRVLEPFLADSANPVHLAFAIPDHPWVDSADGAAVRIAMTVAAPGKLPGTLTTVESETEADNGEVAVTLDRQTTTIAANLRGGADLTACGPLQSNQNLSGRGVQVIGAGFIITPEQATEFGLGSVLGTDKIIRGYRNGKDMTNKPRGVMVIDAFGLSEAEFRERFPAAYQHVFTNVKPERDQNNRDSYRKNWWIFGEPRGNFRPALANLSRYIATVETSKHRFFTFLDKTILPDNMLVNIAHDDAWILGVLSSTVHVRWALAMGGRLGMGNDPRYNKSRCFETFPFPTATEAQKARIRELAEQLDAHRKRQQAAHPELTLTGIYNVLDKLRTSQSLSAKDKKIHDDGLVSVLKQLHDDLDTAVLDAYGWPQSGAGVPPLADRLAANDNAAEALEQDILARLVALNRERAAEEANGQIRYLRPEYQAPGAGEKAEGRKAEGRSEAGEGVPASMPSIQSTLSIPPAADDEAPDRATGEESPGRQVLPWPDELPAQFALVRRLLAEFAQPVADPATAIPTISAKLAGRNTPKRRDQLRSILETLHALGHM
jgi:hypothetical protein